MEINRCYGCMSELTAYPCEKCGYDPEKQKSPDYALRPGAILNGKYLMGRVLGQGGFGITYVGWDLALERKVAIKEYFPSGQVSRHPSTGNALQWYSSQQAIAARQSGMEMFLKEARKMSRVNTISQVVQVRDLFQENNTAYIAMDYIEGETLKNRLAKTGPLNWEDAKKIFLPVIEAMEKVHQAGLIHRDISPDNLMLVPDEGMKILDLGAAKDLNVNSGTSSMWVVKEGFSPLEMYTQTLRSGTWTDVYSIAATMYYSLTGILPPRAVDRVDTDSLCWDLPRLKELPRNVLLALQRALILTPQKRTQTMEEFEQQLVSTETSSVFKLLPAVLLVMIVVTVTLFVALKSKAPVDPPYPTVSSISRHPATGTNVQWEAAVDQMIAAGTQEFYSYLNGAKLELFFDGDLELARVFTNENGVVEYVFKACYDTDGNILEELGYDGEGTLMRREVYTRDADGKILENVRYGQNGKLMEKWVYTYNNNNQEENFSHYDSSLRLDLWGTTTYDASGKGIKIIEDIDGTSYQCHYDERGNLTEFIAMGADGEIDYRDTYRYNSEDQEVEHCSYDGNGELTNKCVSEYSGNTKVRDTQYNYYDGAEYTTFNTYLYAPHGVEIGYQSVDDYTGVHEFFNSIQGMTLRSFSKYVGGEYFSIGTTYYNWDSRMTRDVSYDENGELQSENTFSFDEDGNQTGRTWTYHNNYDNTTKITEYNADGKVISQRTYDASGRLIKSE